METKRRVLVLGDSPLLGTLAAALRNSRLLQVQECPLGSQMNVPGTSYPHVILVDGAQIAPEQFSEILASVSCAKSALISVDPLTYQLTVLSSPCSSRPMANVARIIEILSMALSQPT